MYKAKKGENLWLSLAHAHSSLDASCGGRGTCGKCKIQILEGNLPPTQNEIKKLSEKELRQGIRLACLHPLLEEDITFTLVQNNQGFVISGNDVKNYTSKGEKGHAIAIDIGTTTVVMNLLNLENGKVEKEITFLNPQKIYGADVISRVDSVRVQGIDVIQKCLLKKIEEAIHTFNCKDLVRMSVCGNAVMTHLFMGEDPSSIAQAPYTCKVKEYVELSSKTLFEDVDEFVVQVLPPISAYVGSDIVMDLYEEDFMQYENCLLIDLGTNGEIALIKDGNLYVSSAACGPAFEGGNMEYGCGACEGAIDHVSYDVEWHYTTIKNKKACGVCGSGYMSWISTALQHGFIEESGLMEEDIPLSEEIVLTQKDIREFQLAKSAIAAACEVLCHKANIAYKDVKQLLIAGGFGTHVNKHDLAVLGIIPMQLLSNLKTLGNSAIRGCCKYAIEQDYEKMMSYIQKAETLLLTQEKEFTDLFMMNMMFEAAYED